MTKAERCERLYRAWMAAVEGGDTSRVIIATASSIVVAGAYTIGLSREQLLERIGRAYDIVCDEQKREMN